MKGSEKVVGVVSRELAARVLEVVDAGLVKGLGSPQPGKLCVEAAVCYAMGLPHSDQPSCVLPALRALKIGLNDAAWSSDNVRAAGLRRLAIAQLGSDTLDAVVFAERVAMHSVRIVLPRALRLAGLEPEALKCEQAENPSAAARAAARAAYAADAAYAAADAAHAAAYAAARDSFLSWYVEEVVQILIAMDAPGCAYLDLAPLPAAAAPAGQ